MHAHAPAAPFLRSLPCPRVPVDPPAKALRVVVAVPMAGMRATTAKLLIVFFFVALVPSSASAAVVSHSDHHGRAVEAEAMARHNFIGAAAVHPAAATNEVGCAKAMAAPAHSTVNTVLKTQKEGNHRGLRHKKQKTSAQET